MDDRFDNGANLIIYGDSSGISKNKLGKTMLASIVMKEAIWRRMFKTNKAYTYSFKSCPEIVDDTISKKNAEQNVNPFTADWLCIDDVFLRTRQTQGNVLDQIMSVRLRENLPSIIVIQFDPFKLQNAEEAIGNHIMKMLSDKTNTFVVSLG
jgi:DNA replication protein DnaC